CNFFAETHECWVVDSGIRHNLADSDYNNRRAECETALRALQAEFGADTIPALRDATMDQILVFHDRLAPEVFRRAFYIHGECERVRIAASLLKRPLPQLFGVAMFDAHAGLRDGFEVSIPEIDLLVATAEASKHAVGARLVGGGFGGCTLNLVEKGKGEPFLDQLNTAFQKAYGRRVQGWKVELVDGVQTKMDLKGLSPEFRW
ncbi:MAG: hypothetical protein AAF570_20270, partial [Bacteroidota bacterium]